MVAKNNSPQSGYPVSTTRRRDGQRGKYRLSVVLAMLLSSALLLNGCSDDDDDDDDKTTSGAGGSTPTSTPNGAGSSGSSSGGGGSTTPLQSPFAGQYNGTVTATASAPGVGSATDSFNLRASVDGNARMTFSSEGFSFSTNIRENGGFSERVPFDLTDDDINCEGTMNVVGNIAGNTLSGNISGPVSCSSGNLSVDGTVSGNFDAGRR